MQNPASGAALNLLIALVHFGDKWDIPWWGRDTGKDKQKQDVPLKAGHLATMHNMNTFVGKNMNFKVIFAHNYVVVAHMLLSGGGGLSPKMTVLKPSPKTTDCDPYCKEFQVCELVSFLKLNCQQEESGRQRSGVPCLYFQNLQCTVVRCWRCKDNMPLLLLLSQCWKNPWQLGNFWWRTPVRNNCTRHFTITEFLAVVFGPLF